jgi:hypothetical protein
MTHVMQGPSGRLLKVSEQSSSVEKVTDALVKVRLLPFIGTVSKLAHQGVRRAQAICPGFGMRSAPLQANALAQG